MRATLVERLVLVACVACLAFCGPDPQKFVLSTDGTTLSAVGTEPLSKIIPVDRTVKVGDGNQSNLLYYDWNARQLWLLSPESPNIFRMVGSYVFTDGLVPKSIISVSTIANDIVLVQLHVDPTNSWFALWNTRAKHVQAYFASEFACDESGTHIAYIVGPPHFGSGNAEVFVNGRTIAILTVKNYWHIRWDSPSGTFVLFNDQQEMIHLESFRIHPNKYDNSRNGLTNAVGK
jgi:hypothetical protein